MGAQGNFSASPLMVPGGVVLDSFSPRLAEELFWRLRKGKARQWIMSRLQKLCFPSGRITSRSRADAEGQTTFSQTEPMMFQSVIEVIRWEPIPAVAGFPEA